MRDLARVIVQASSVSHHLNKLGVPMDALVKAAQNGFIERAMAHPSDPVTAAGTDAWRYTVRSLRASLVDIGWRVDDPQNLPIAINDHLRVNITVSSGDEATGNPQKEPKTKNPKGTLLEAAVDRNAHQRELFPETISEAKRQFENTIEYPTWVLLIYITDEEIRAELSLPNSYGENSHLDGWACRLILEIPLPDEETHSTSEDEDESEIVPQVKPRI